MGRSKSYDPFCSSDSFSLLSIMAYIVLVSLPVNAGSPRYISPISFGNEDVIDPNNGDTFVDELS